MGSTKRQKKTPPQLSYIHWCIYGIKWHYFVNIKPDSMKISILGMFVLLDYQSESSSNNEINFKNLEQIYITWNMDGSVNEKSSYLRVFKIVGKYS